MNWKWYSYWIRCEAYHIQIHHSFARSCAEVQWFSSRNLLLVRFMCLLLLLLYLSLGVLAAWAEYILRFFRLNIHQFQVHKILVEQKNKNPTFKIYSEFICCCRCIIIIIINFFRSCLFHSLPFNRPHPQIQIQLECEKSVHKLHNTIRARSRICRACRSPLLFRRNSFDSINITIKT